MGKKRSLRQVKENIVCGEESEVGPIKRKRLRNDDKESSVAVESNEDCSYDSFGDEEFSNGGNIPLGRVLKESISKSNSFPQHSSSSLEEFTFEFYDMKVDYAEGITTLLRGLYKNPSLSYDIASTISSQDTVGTAVLCEGGDDVFAFATVLSHNSFIACVPLKNGLNAVLAAIEGSTCLSRDTRDIMVRHMSQNEKACRSTGLLLHRRYANFPLQLIHALYDNLHEDVQWCRQQSLALTSKDPSTSTTASSVVTESLGPIDKSYDDFKDMTHMLLMSGCSISDDVREGSVGLKEGQVMRVDRSVLFDEFEDEVLMSHALGGIVYKQSSMFKTPVCLGIIPLSAIKPILAELQAMCPM